MRKLLFVGLNSAFLEFQGEKSPDEYREMARDIQEKAEEHGAKHIGKRMPRLILPFFSDAEFGQSPRTEDGPDVMMSDAEGNYKDEDGIFLFNSDALFCGKAEDSEVVVERRKGTFYVSAVTTIARADEDDEADPDCEETYSYANMFEVPLPDFVAKVNEYADALDQDMRQAQAPSR